MQIFNNYRLKNNDEVTLGNNGLSDRKRFCSTSDINGICNQSKHSSSLSKSI